MTKPCLVCCSQQQTQFCAATRGIQQQRLLWRWFAYVQGNTRRGGPVKGSKRTPEATAAGVAGHKKAAAARKAAAAAAAAAAAGTDSYDDEDLSEAQDGAHNCDNEVELQPYAPGPLGGPSRRRPSKAPQQLQGNGVAPKTNNTTKK